jgi:hypothetical protein
MPAERSSLRKVRDDKALKMTFSKPTAKRRQELAGVRKLLAK